MIVSIDPKDWLASHERRHPDSINLMCSIELGKDAIRSCSGDVKKALMTNQELQAEVVLADLIERCESPELIKQRIIELALVLGATCED
jgi:hypothetical protein